MLQMALLLLSPETIASMYKAGSTLKSRLVANLIVTVPVSSLQRMSPPPSLSPKALARTQAETDAWTHHRRRESPY